MANLFGRQRLRALAPDVPVARVEEALAIVRAWHNDYHHGSLKRDKETSREQAYNQDFFIKILGYREKPASPYTFEPKATTEFSQLPDALLSYTDLEKGTVNVAAVVELKAAGIPLDRPQQRAGNLSPVQQGFKYKPQYRNCPFVIVSNFFELRLYNDNQLDYERWTLDDLVDPSDDYLLLRTFYLLLHADNLTSVGGKSRTQSILSDIRTQQESIGRDFYRTYKTARLDLLRDIYRHNEIVRTDIELGIEKAQTIIDRIVFCCFAEDRDLLPEDTIQRVLKAGRESTFGGSLWSVFKSFFEAVDRGSALLGIPRGYNGGLFARDEVLDGLRVSDDALIAVADMSKYNFAEDLSVNILGHIFEQSITDLEEVKAKVQKSRGMDGLASGGAAIVSKRKLEGIFYTPDYVVRHIVENTLGTALREHEERCKQEFRLSQRLGEAGYEAQERKAYLKYQEILQGVKVVDPACGSGAFLVHVFDYLLAENLRVDEILGGTLVSDEDYVRDILRNNIYGVDLNEESVEITKLSLWLKTAKPGKQLTALDANIRSGNSIIDDVRIAGEKAFDWKESFPGVFANGGFDVVVGNPPYGVKFSSGEKQYLVKLDPLVPDFEIYVYFLSLVKRIVKPDGYLGYIFPNTFLSNVFGKKYRADLFAGVQVPLMIDLSNDPTFQDAAVRTVVVCLRNSPGEYTTMLARLDDQKALLPLRDRTRRQLLDSVDNLLAVFTRDEVSEALIATIRRGSQALRNFFDVSQGLIPYDKYRGHDAYTVSNRIWHADSMRDETYRKELKGGDVNRYAVRWNGRTWISYGDWLAAPRDPKFFRRPRILVREITERRLYAAYTEDEYYNTPSIINCVAKEGSTVSMLAVVALLNSKLLGWYHNRTSPKAAKGLFPKILVGDVRELPLKSSTSEELERGARRIMESLANLDAADDRFRKLVRVQYGLGRWPSLAEAWWELEFSELVAVLGLGRTSLAMKDDLLALYEVYREKCTEFARDFECADRSVDRMVYAIYGLSGEQVAVVESF